MNPCELILPKVATHVDGELPASDREEIENHLESCEECKIAAEDFRWLDQVAGREVAPPVSSDEWDGLRAAVLEKAKAPATGPAPLPMPARHERGSRWWIPAISLAALVLIGLYLGWHFVDHDELIDNEGLEGPGIAENIETHEPKIEEGEEGELYIDYEDF